MITISGSSIPTPSGYQVGIQDLSKAERNANGLMIIERIATKRKLEISYNYLSQANYSNLLNKMSTIFFTVTYPDPVTGAIKSGTFYVGDRSSEAIDYQNGVIRWKSVKFNLIER